MQDYFLLIIGALIIIIGSLISFNEKKKDNIDTKKSNKYNTRSFVIILLGICLTFYSGLISLNDKHISDNKRQKSDSLSLDFQNKLQAKSDYIIEIQKNNYDETKNLNGSLATAKDRIIYLQNEINNNITGSTKPCYIVFQTSGDIKGSTILINDSQLPIFNLDIRITDFSELLKCKNSKYENFITIDESCYNNCSFIASSELVRPGNLVIPEYSLPIDKDQGYLEIRFIYKTNVEYLEQLVFKREANNIRCKARLFKLVTGKYIFIKYIINPINLTWEVDFNKIFTLPLTERKFGPIYWR